MARKKRTLITDPHLYSLYWWFKFIMGNWHIFLICVATNQWTLQISKPWAFPIYRYYKVGFLHNVAHIYQVEKYTERKLLDKKKAYIYNTLKSLILTSTKCKKNSARNININQINVKQSVIHFLKGFFVSHVTGLFVFLDAHSALMTLSYLLSFIFRGCLWRHRSKTRNYWGEWV